MFAALALATALGASPAGAQAALNADGCAAIAIKSSGLITEAQGKVDEWAGRLAEVQSVFFPKLFGLGYVAPLYRVSGGPLDADVKRDLLDWGPYFHLQAILAQPLYTFGRASAGEKAAKGRWEVEKARFEQTKNTLALEVRKFYYLHLFARSMQPSLDNAKKIISEAEKKAKEMYATGSGKVTNVDLMRLRYGATELERYLIQAQMGESLSLAALKHTMGLAATEEIVLADETLPPPPSEEPAPLEELVRHAFEKRPEVAQLRSGEKAATAYEDAERLAVAPTVFAAAQIDLNWTYMWPDQPNPFFWDRFNDITPGLAVGLQFDIDPWKAKARGDAAHGLVTQVAGLKKFAETGIPMEVRKARDDWVQAQRTVKLADEGAVATRKWMIFAGAAYVTGTGEAKDVLEGVAAYLMAKKNYYETLQALHVARATILYATGEP